MGKNFGGVFFDTFSSSESDPALRFASKLFDHEISELLSLVVHDCNALSLPDKLK